MTTSASRRATFMFAMSHHEKYSKVPLIYASQLPLPEDARPMYNTRYAIVTDQSNIPHYRLGHRFVQGVLAKLMGKISHG